MKKLAKLCFGRAAVVGALIVLQLVVLALLVTYLSAMRIYVYWAFQLGSFAVVLWILTRTENPSYKLAWCIPILVFPLFGGLFYLLFGRHPTRERELLPKTAPKLAPTQHAVAQALRERAPALFRQAQYMERCSGYPVYKHTQVGYFPLGEDKWAALLSELTKAKKFILMEYFIVEPGRMWNSIVKILQEKAKNGVEVKLIYDDVGSIQTMPANAGEGLRRAGVEITVFNPFRPRLNSAANYRDHRKITVVDGNVGFCGGINLADEYINAYPKHGHWKDTAVLLKGEAVWSLTHMFLCLWEQCNHVVLQKNRYRPTLHPASDGFVQAFADSPMDALKISENAYMQIIYNAHQYVYITTPYLILDNEMTTALSLAAQSGVDVRIITPHVADKWFVHLVTQSYYPQLVQAGVKIYEYTPGFIHAKMVVCDDEVALVGTTNLDYRSFYLHFECAVLFYHSSVTAAIKKDVLSVLGVSQEITEKSCQSKGHWHIFIRSLLRAFAPLM